MSSRLQRRKCPACGKMKTFRSDVKTCGCRGSNPFAKRDTVKEQSTVTASTWDISIVPTRIHTLEQLIKAFEIDLAIWEVERFVANKWDMGFVNKEGDPSQHELYQVKAFLKKKVDVENARNEVEALKVLAKTYAPDPPRIDRKTQMPANNLLVINLSDHHFGKLAWGYETGRTNYDVGIATDVFNRAFDDILARSSNYKFDEIWFVVGNDLFNSDDRQGRTTKGTVVSTDVRYTRTMTVVRNVLIACIEQLRHYAPLVKVKMMSGNHDEFSVWHTGSSLECWFSKYEDVQIDNTPKYYKVDQFGKVMIMWTHGDKGNRKNFPLLMATEYPGMFGETRFREVHTGHIHQDKVTENHGVKVRILSSLSPVDRWHAENAFTGNLRSSEAFVYNRERGLIATVIYTDDDSLIDSGSPVNLPEGV
jgi:hypothetical protein